MASRQESLNSRRREAVQNDTQLTPGPEAGWPQSCGVSHTLSNSIIPPLDIPYLEMSLEPSKHLTQLGTTKHTVLHSNLMVAWSWTHFLSHNHPSPPSLSRDLQAFPRFLSPICTVVANLLSAWWSDPRSLKACCYPQKTHMATLFFFQTVCGVRASMYIWKHIHVCTYMWEYMRRVEYKKSISKK